MIGSLSLQGMMARHGAQLERCLCPLLLTPRCTWQGVWWGGLSLSSPPSLWRPHWCLLRKEGLLRGNAHVRRPPPGCFPVGEELLWGAATLREGLAARSVNAACSAPWPAVPSGGSRGVAVSATQSRSPWAPPGPNGLHLLRCFGSTTAHAGASVIHPLRCCGTSEALECQVCPSPKGVCVCVCMHCLHSAPLLPGFSRPRLGYHALLRLWGGEELMGAGRYNFLLPQ